MKMLNWQNLTVLVVIVLVIGGIGFLIYQNNQPGKLDVFAQCLADKNLKFYGAFWCPHCQSQKLLFRNSQKLLPYVECSTPNGNDQLEVCRQKEIKVYPTWEFSDGSRLEGELSLKNLSEKSGCQISR